jgi:hypothetical protein
VLAPGGVAAGSSVARVRLVATPGTGQASVAAPVRALADAMPAVADAAFDVRPPKAPVTTPNRSRARSEKSKGAAAPAVARQRHWPEGASGLGAVTPSTERQIWWKLPPPSWAPSAPTTANQP